MFPLIKSDHFCGIRHPGSSIDAWLRLQSTDVAREDQDEGQSRSIAEELRSRVKQAKKGMAARRSILVDVGSTFVGITGSVCCLQEEGVGGSLRTSETKAMIGGQA
jgi:hypothetical protein